MLTKTWSKSTFLKLKVNGTAKTTLMCVRVYGVCMYVCVCVCVSVLAHQKQFYCCEAQKRTAPKHYILSVFIACKQCQEGFIAVCVQIHAEETLTIEDAW